MARVPYEMLREAALAGNRCIDGSAHVLKRGGRRIKIRKALPPFVQAAFELHDPSGPSPPPWLTVAEFERLSLAARCHMLGHDVDASIGVDRSAFPWVDAKDLLRLIAELSTMVPPYVRVDRSSMELDLKSNIRARSGIQIVGCRIGGKSGHRELNALFEPDPEGRNALRLVNGVLPFSIRLIGCVIESQLCINGCDMVTLDLSGSAMRGLDATFLQARGSVRLRRSAIFSPADFSGARIRGVFDATDCVVMPWLRQAPGQAFSPERGALNLTEATFENDVYLTRSRIWGGLRFTDAIMERSVFMNLAAIRSPVAILERVGADLAAVANPEHKGLTGLDEWKAFSSLRDRSFELARRLHAWRDPTGTVGSSAFVDAEAVWLSQGARTKVGTAETILTALSASPPGMEPLYKLLTENMRARTTAVWADGATVKGRIFARGLKAYGRLRFRYVNVGDGFHLEDSLIRSGVLVGATLDGLKKIADSPFLGDTDRARKMSILFDLRRSTRDAADGRDYPDDDPYALDIREAKFGGSVELGDCEGGPSFITLGMAAGPERLRGTCHGVVAADRVEIKGSFSVARVCFSTPHKNGGDGEDTERHMAGGGVDRRDTYVLALARAKIGGDFDARYAKDLNGINLEDAVIGGSVLFFDPSEAREMEETHTPERSAQPLDTFLRKIWVVHGLLWRIYRPLNVLARLVAKRPEIVKSAIPVTGRAQGLQGNLMLRGATIGGDATLVFDPDVGPNIKAQLCKIGGRLDVYPAQVGDERQSFSMDYGSFLESEYRSRIARHERSVDSLHMTPNDWAASGRRKPYIDLRNARAVIFCHPPPAWPQQGALSIAGFSYQRTPDFGPLAPHPFSTEPAAPAPLRPSQRLLRQVRGLLLLALLLAAVVAVHWAPVQSFILTASEMLVAAGTWNLALAAAWITAWGGSVLMRRASPRLNETEPMAMSYLLRQRVARNRYRTPGAIYWPLDPYITASKALREEGRYLSAHAVEVARMRQRTSMLSLRHHFLAKGFLKFIDMTAKYGFDVSRVVFILLGVILAAALVAQYAYSTHALVPVEKDSATFISLVYAADVVIPFLDFEQTKLWKTAMPPGVSAAIPQLYHVWPIVFGGIGLLLTTVAATALVARAESVFARTEE